MVKAVDKHCFDDDLQRAIAPWKLPIPIILLLSMPIKRATCARGITPVPAALAPSHAILGATSLIIQSMHLHLPDCKLFVRGTRVDTSEIRVVRLGRQFPHTFNCIAWPVYNIVPNNLVHARVVMNHQSDDSTSLPCRPESGTYSLTWHNALQSNYITLPATMPSTLFIFTHGVATLYTTKQCVAATHVPFRPGRVTYFLTSHSTPTSN